MTSAFSIIFKGNHTKIFDFFLDNPRYDFTTTEVSRNAEVNRITANKITEYFLKIGIIKQSRKLGNGQLYILNIENPAVKAVMKTELEMIKTDIKLNIPVKVGK
ncbi:MAG: hypothetical protein KJ906_03510 [Nanoarchaeota archaeon]|nr:hypothetical protein [Nanoarchaeota archaeon]